MKTKIIIFAALNIAFLSTYLQAADDLDIYGGTFTIDKDYNWVDVYNNSVVDMFNFSIFHLDIYNTSTFNLYGGTLTNSNTNVWDSGIFNVSGGNVQDIVSRGSSIVNVSGGDTNWITANDNSTVYLTGGNISTLDAPGANAYFHIYGYDLRIEAVDRLKGCWENGDPFDMYLRRSQFYGDHYVLHEIPEPQSLLLLVLGCFFARRKISNTSI
jgi:hypothetical protein